MANLCLVGLDDVVRSLGDDPFHAQPLAVADALERDLLLRGPATFNYNPVLKALRMVVRGTWSFGAALSYVRTSGAPGGLVQNEAVLQALESYLTENFGRGYVINFAAVKIGSVGRENIHVGLKSPAAIVRSDQASVVFPNFRKTFTPSLLQARLACSVAKHAVARDDLYGAEIECVSTPGMPRTRERELVVRREAELSLFTKDEVDVALSIYLEAVAILIERGYPTRPPASTYRVIDPDQPGLFG